RACASAPTSSGTPRTSWRGSRGMTMAPLWTAGRAPSCSATRTRPRSTGTSTCCLTSSSRRAPRNGGPWIATWDSLRDRGGRRAPARGTSMEPGGAMMGELVRLSRKNDVYGLSWAPAETIHRYVRVFTLRDVVRGLRRSARELEEMARAGVLLARVNESSYRLVTTD